VVPLLSKCKALSSNLSAIKTIVWIHNMQYKKIDASNDIYEFSDQGEWKSMWINWQADGEIKMGNCVRDEITNSKNFKIVNFSTSSI
jgi:hypothetical protein